MIQPNITTLSLFPWFWASKMTSCTTTTSSSNLALMYKDLTQFKGTVQVGGLKHLYLCTLSLRENLALFVAVMLGKDVQGSDSHWPSRRIHRLIE